MAYAVRYPQSLMEIADDCQHLAAAIRKQSKEDVASIVHHAMGPLLYALKLSIGEGHPPTVGEAVAPSTEQLLIADALDAFAATVKAGKAGVQT